MSHTYWIGFKEHACNIFYKHICYACMLWCRVIANDTAGTVFDGGDPAEDIDYQSDDTVLTATFHGFEVTSCDIEHVTWAASTQRDDPEVDMSFTGHGLTVTSPSASTPISGHVHAPMSSLQGKRFFLTIRVQTACGTVLQATSDGVLVDNSPSVVSTSTFTDGQPSSSVPQYSADSTVSLASWAHTDQQSGVEKTDVSIGTYPGGSDILPVAASQGNQLQRGQGTQGDSGLSRYTLVTARNKAGLTTQSVTDPAVIDTTKPTKGQVGCHSVCVNPGWDNCSTSSKHRQRTSLCSCPRCMMCMQNTVSNGWQIGKLFFVLV